MIPRPFRAINVLGLVAILPYTLLALDLFSPEAQTWCTWAGATCQPQKILYPTSLANVSKIIKRAAKQQVPVRFIGSGHSLNELVCTHGYLVNTDYFDEIVYVDKKNQTARVQGGIKLKKLFKILARTYHLALPNQGFIKEQSIAGALATSTHGSGKTGTLSDFIVSIELIDGQGTYRYISRKHNPQWFEAACMNLGALGFVYAVTLQCVPLFVLEHKRTLKSWDYVLDHLDEYYTCNDYFMLMAHPESTKTLVYTWNKTTKSPTNNFFLRLSEKLFSNKVTNYLTVNTAHIAPGIMNEIIEPLFRAMQQKKHREYSYKSLSPVKVPLAVHDYIEEEIAIPRSYFAQAIRDIFRLYETYRNRDFELVGFITCRFALSSKHVLLSPTYQQDVAYISLITINKFADCASFYKDFEKLMMKYPCARPHWGKHNNITTAHVKKLWPESFDKFDAARKELDPYNVFINDYLAQRLL